MYVVILNTIQNNPQENRKLRPGEVVEEKKVKAKNAKKHYVNAVRYIAVIKVLTVSLNRKINAFASDAVSYTKTG